MAKLVECIPNFSEGRDLEKVETELNALRTERDELVRKA